MPTRTKLLFVAGVARMLIELKRRKIIHVKRLGIRSTAHNERGMGGRTREVNDVKWVTENNDSRT